MFLNHMMNGNRLSMDKKQPNLSDEKEGIMGFKRIEITKHFNPSIGKGGLSVLWQQLNRGVHVLNEF